MALLAAGSFPAAYAQVDVTTFHNDVARTGQNTLEVGLTTANVNTTQFGKLFTTAVDGYVYAQPLYVSNVSIAAGTHDVVYVATEHDSVYAIDADDGTVYWHSNLIPTGGRTIVASTDIGTGCNDIIPEIGITGTPVIDTSTGTLYVVAKSYVGGKGVQYLHALDIHTSAEKFGGPTLIQGSIPGSAYDAKKSVLTFNSMQEDQRPALLLDHGHVIIGWGSHCDFDPWHGWLMSYGAATLAQEAIYSSAPNGREGGIWMSGGGPAADASGNIYFSTGNGDWNGTTDFGDTIVKLGLPSGGSFPLVDYFTPYNQARMYATDDDLASSGPILLPTLPSNRQLLTLMAKVGTIYVVDRNDMGGYCVNQTPACTTSDPQIAQEIPHATTGVWGSPAYWNGNVYWAAQNDALTAFSFNTTTGSMSTAPSSKSAQIFGYPAPTPAISSNGNANGILWVLNANSYDSSCSGGTTNCQILYAYDATNLGHLLYTSNQAGGNRDVPGAAVKFATPTIANGKVYVGSQYAVSGFGELKAGTTAAAIPTFTPAAGTYTSAQSVKLSDSTPGATIYYTLNGTTPSSGSTPYNAAFTVGATTTVKAIAVATGYATSADGSATYTINLSAAPVSVPLTSDDKLYGIGTPGTAITGGGIDGAGNAYAGNLLGTSLTFNGISYKLPVAGANTAATNTKIPLPAGSFTTLHLLGAAVNGNHLNQVFKVTYTDGTTTSFTQSLSSWAGTPQGYAGESLALTMPDYVTSSGATKSGTRNVYAYSFALNGAKTVKTLTLPPTTNVVVLSVELSR